MNKHTLLIIFFTHIALMPSIAFSQCDCYGEWEFIPGSGVRYGNVTENHFDSEYMSKSLLTESLPNILIVKDSIYCVEYLDGEYSEETGWSMSRVPKYEDAFIFLDKPKYSNPQNCLKKTSSVKFNHLVVHKSIDVLGKLTEEARFISSCDNHQPLGSWYFNCCTGDYFFIEQFGDGGGEAIYFKFKKKGARESKTYTLKAIVNPKEIKPDGKSVSEISVTLLEHVDGVSGMSKPVPGKILSFDVLKQFDKIPGRLSSSLSVTDEKGVARVQFIAPDFKDIADSKILINTATIKVRQDEFNIEDIIYINFTPDKVKLFVEPSNGIVSNYGIVPPDKRFPAKIRAYFEDENLEPRRNAEVFAEIRGENPVGTLRSKIGTESNRLVLTTDNFGIAEFFYLYTGKEVPVQHIIEEIEIKTTNMIQPVIANISIGLNIVIDKVENGYEGKGIINTGEQIPLMIRVKDAWNPEVDLSEIINYWGSGTGTGDSRLDLKLEIVNLSSIPDYYLDHMRQQRFPETPFKENIQVRSFKDKKEYNILWVPESSLQPYGFPRVKPAASGNHYYEARIGLVDQHGKNVFSSGHPGAKAYFNLQTGMAADALYIFFVQNPLKPQTREAEVFSFALNLLGMGTLISVVDAMDAINRGDSDALFNILFSEVKGFFIDQAKEKSPDFKKVMDSYARISMAETIAKEIGSNMNGAVAGMEKQLYSKLIRNADNANEQVIILQGNGAQKLFLAKSEKGGEEGVNLFKGKVNIKISGIDDKTKETAGKIKKLAASKGKEVNAYENKLHFDSETGITSLKKGDKSYFIVPAGIEVSYENAVMMHKY